MKKVRIYEYSGCSTCKSALKYLEKNKIPYDRVPIVETPPSVAELKKMIGYLGGQTRKLFNTSGVVYREMKLSDKLDEMSSNEILKLLSRNGKLVKRPFLLVGNQGTVGFNKVEWDQIFG